MDSKDLALLHLRSSRDFRPLLFALGHQLLVKYQQDGAAIAMIRYEG